MLLYKVMEHGEKSIIVAYDLDRTIGRENKLPWENQLPVDMRHFSRLTAGKSLVMGRKTFESLPDRFRPLPNRQNIVVSRTQQEGFNDVNTDLIGAGSLEDAFSKAHSEIMVIGGAQIYEQALPLVDRVYVTRIITHTEGGDAFFPELPADEWESPEAPRQFHEDSVNRFRGSFITYLRRNPIQR